MNSILNTIIKDQIDTAHWCLRNSKPSHALDYYRAARELILLNLRDPTLPLNDCAKYAGALGKTEKLIERVNDFLKGNEQ